MGVMPLLTQSHSSESIQEQPGQVLFSGRGPYSEFTVDGKVGGSLDLKDRKVKREGQGVLPRSGRRWVTEGPVVPMWSHFFHSRAREQDNHSERTTSELNALLGTSN